MEDEITPAPDNPAIHRVAPSPLPPVNPNIMEDLRAGRIIVTPGQLSTLTSTKDLAIFHSLGGLDGLAVALQTDLEHGLDDSDSATNNGTTTALDHRRATYGTNRLPAPPRPSSLHFAWMAFNDKLMLLLTASATVNLALGIYQAVTAAAGEPSVEWVEGVSILVAVIVIEEREVTVFRGAGLARQISIYEILVGDLVHVETGDVLPADGILVQGFGVQCDESSATGESELIDKTTGWPNLHAPPAPGSAAWYDPFMLSGSKVTNGVGRFLVTAVGEHSSHGRIMLSLRDEVEETPLQQKLEVLARHIVTIGLTVGGVFFVVIFVRFLCQLGQIEGGARGKGEEFLNVLILAITVVVIAVPEGLPLAVTMALAFATTRMLKDKNLVRRLRSCEIMGNATTICSDKTGTLTQNKMLVVGGRVGISGPFGDVPPAPGACNHHVVSLPSAVGMLPDLVKDLVKDSIVLNSTALEKGTQGDGMQLAGTSTEVALIEFVRDHLDLVDGEGCLWLLLLLLLRQRGLLHCRVSVRQRARHLPKHELFVEEVVGVSAQADDEHCPQRGGACASEFAGDAFAFVFFW
ncbi:hypothetical protein BO86DRAFT_413615 [Aspergillus japonicus CBS 114.51]|uniref:Cation-transporting P-type ATPase N-terminal domain-containing protein n=1 Tax=Aspergillus japonicus CBS 114.51 TaxID=1448312 RepID=A0A8T8WM41_ASPJA|nr:hypothetical protein BO86DRAFT_413615 [Aspergillus japonicus CBS 114.51]RAH76774.1 hypothetical protein BO86DRAFT_413615 [Aspergillus japonicus CBS 114.51]